MEGEVLGVLFFGVCGLVVLVVPFLDQGPRSRFVLNMFAGVSVVFFIFMTAWGYFDQLTLQIILGSFLMLGMLLLILPLLRRPGRFYRLTYLAIALVSVLMLAAVAWEISR